MSKTHDDDRAPLLHVTDQDEHMGYQPTSDDTEGSGSKKQGGTDQFMRLLRERPYVIWVLFLMLCAYLLNQLDRYTIGVVSKEIEKELHFGDGKGKGSEYQLLAGPVFQLVYTLSGIPIGYLADRYSRKNILVISLLFWSFCTAAMGLAGHYWELALARAGQGMGEAGCTPVANGIISEYFAPETRGTALGIYNFGIYTGYSLAFALGNVISDAEGYRAVFYICGGLGVPVAALIYFTVREPARGVYDQKDKDGKPQRAYTVKEVLVWFATRPSLLLLCLAGAVRNAGGTVWAYNTQNFFKDVHDQSKSEIAAYMGWIPLVGGSAGALFGGFIADRVIKNRGSWARIWVLVISQLVAAPFSLGALLLPVPYAYLALIPANIIGEMWVGVTLAVVVELVTPGMRVLAVAVYFFIISNIAGAATLLVTPFESIAGSFRGSLIILYPGLYLASGVLFFLTLTVLKRDMEKAARQAELEAMEAGAEDALVKDSKVSYQAIED